MGLKAPDSQTLALCLQCHKDLHEKLGMFRVMDRPALKSWQLAKIAHYQLLYQRHLGQKLAHALSARKLAREPSAQLDSDQGDTTVLVAELTDS